MGCNGKDNREAIEIGKNNFAELRELFIKRMTVDSEHNDRRKKDYNQAIFKYQDPQDIDAYNRECEKYGLTKIGYDETYQVFSRMDMNMVLTCFDNAVKDWRRKWCDDENCKRK